MATAQGQESRRDEGVGWLTHGRKRPVDDISEDGTENVSEVAVVGPLSPAPTALVRREPKRRLPTLSAISMAGFDDVGVFTA